jgi:signal transduction histidine kinase
MSNTPPITTTNGVPEENNTAVKHISQRARLLKLSQSISTLTTFDEVIHKTLHSLGELVEFDVSSFLKVDKNAQMFQPHSVLRQSEHAPQLDRFVSPLDKGIFGLVYSTAESIILNNAHLNTASVYPNGAMIRKEHLISIPVKVNGAIVGIFTVARYDDPEFSQETFELIQIFISHATLAINNAHLYATTRQRSIELSIILEATQAITSTLDVEKTLMLIAEQMVKITNVAGCTLSRINKGTDAVSTWIEWRRKSPDWADPPGKTYNLKEYPAISSAINSRQPLVIHAMQTDIYPAETKLMREMETISLLILPLAVGDNVIGMVELDEQDFQRDFSTAEIQLCQALANQASIAIANAQLYSETRRQLQQQKALRKAGLAITSSLRPNAVLKQIAEQFINILDITSAYICSYNHPEKTSTVLAEAFSPEAKDREKISDLGTTYYLPNDFPETARLLLSDDEFLTKKLDSTTAPTELAHFETFGAKSILTLLLKFKDTLIAYVDIWDTRQERDFSTTEISLAQSLGQMAAVAIQNARLFEQAKQEIIEREQVESQRADLEEKLRHAQKMEAVGQLAGGIAHDFNNLLTSIMGFSQLALDALDGDQRQAEQEILSIQAAAQRAADLTGRLLTFARKQTFYPKPLFLNKLIANTENMLCRLIREDIELTTDLSPELWPIEADHGQLEQVLVNLVVNARDALPNGGKIEVKTNNIILNHTNAGRHGELPTGEYVVLTVTDTGAGIPAEMQHRVFEPFFTTKETGQGSGLGLAICFGIVNQHGGHISISSEPNKGTIAQVCLRKTITAVKPNKTARTLATAPTGTETVLVVEDDHIVRNLTADSLKHHGYHVFAAEDGLAALELLKNDIHIDLLITDLVMPRMGGKELSERLKSRFSRLRVLFVTGYPTDELALKEFLALGDAYLQKPFFPALLVRKARELLDGQIQ